MNALKRKNTSSHAFLASHGAGKNSRVPNVNGHRRWAVEYLKELGIPVVLWRGGCFADD